MRLQSLPLLAGASVVAANSTSILFLPGFDVQSLDGKILGSSGPMTTYLLNCPPGEDPNKCGLPPNGYTVTEGASSAIMAVSYDAVTMAQSCKFQNTIYANCVATVTSGGSTSAMTTGFSIIDIPYGGFIPVHITATETAGASVSTDVSASTTTTSAKDTTLMGTVTSTSNTSTTTASTSDSTNAAMPMVTGNARWVVGGAAALAMAVV